MGHPAGSLGTYDSETGTYEDSDIPGAVDDSEVFDMRHARHRCSLGSFTRTGPHGIAVRLDPDHGQTYTKETHGESKIVAESAGFCIITPLYTETWEKGRKSYFQWYEYICSSGPFSDHMTGLEFLRSEAYETMISRRDRGSTRECITDWWEFFWEGVWELLKKGASSVDFMKLLGPLGLFGMTAQSSRSGMPTEMAGFLEKPSMEGLTTLAHTLPKNSPNKLKEIVGNIEMNGLGSTTKTKSVKKQLSELELVKKTRTSKRTKRTSTKRKTSTKAKRARKTRTR